MRPLAWLAALGLLMTAAAATPAPDIARDLAPGGRLRAAINYGNPVLAQRSPAGELSGVSVDLARELGRQLGVPVDLVPYDAAGKVTAAAKSGAWDVAFLAVDPVRANELSFTAPYVVIEGTYLVPKDSNLRMIEDVDREGVRIAVGAGSAYDLYLIRTLKRAFLVRASTSAGAVDLFVRSKLEAAAGVKQPLVAFAAQNPQYRAIEGRFMLIEQAMATPKGRDAGLTYLRGFVEEMKASGFVAEALRKSDQPDAAVAPAAPVR
ncbi:MAG TPA: ABC transporter substrate-binding protein [Beijerinckiaceae bacterium]|jgi:polar amino acid transport system substrate-binding protein